MRIKNFQPWKRAFLWSDVRSANDIFAAGDAADAIDEALDFFVSSVASAPARTTPVCAWPSRSMTPVA